MNQAFTGLADLTWSHCWGIRGEEAGVGVPSAGGSGGRGQTPARAQEPPKPQDWAWALLDVHRVLRNSFHSQNWSQPEVSESGEWGDSFV